MVIFTTNQKAKFRKKMVEIGQKSGKYINRGTISNCDLIVVEMLKVWTVFAGVLVYPVSAELRDDNCFSCRSEMS